MYGDRFGKSLKKWACGTRGRVRAWRASLEHNPWWRDRRRIEQSRRRTRTDVISARTWRHQRTEETRETNTLNDIEGTRRLGGRGRDTCYLVLKVGGHQIWQSLALILHWTWKILPKTSNKSSCSWPPLSNLRFRKQPYSSWSRGHSHAPIQLIIFSQVLHPECILSSSPLHRTVLWPSTFAWCHLIHIPMVPHHVSPHQNECQRHHMGRGKKYTVRRMRTGIPHSMEPFQPSASTVRVGFSNSNDHLTPHTEKRSNWNETVFLVC